MASPQVPVREYENMSEVILKTLSLSDEAFDKILTTYAQYVIKVEDIAKYLHGNRCKASIYYDGAKKMVLTQASLKVIGYECDNNWKQCICLRNPKQEESFRSGLAGGLAWRKMFALLKKFYSEDEINECFSKFTKPYDKNTNQLHFNYTPRNAEDVAHKFSNCFKYDINGAYAKALCDIFPRAKEAILKLYNERKKKPENKDLINYFVGMMCVKGYRETYNWIVQNVRKQMEETIEYLNGILLYANTDGFVIHAAVNQLTCSKALGDFKLEYQGDAYIYAGDNHWIIQCGDEVTGSCLCSVRKYINLREGKAVQYKRIRNGHIFTAEELICKEVRIINHG